MYSAGRKAFASLRRYVTSTEAICTKLTLAGQLLVKNSCTEFHEILTSVLTVETTSQTDRQTDGRACSPLKVRTVVNI